MKETRFFYVPEAATAQELPPEEAAHAVRVLRLTAGDTVYLMDGKGSFFEAEVTLATAKHCAYRIVQHMPQPAPWWGHIHLAMAPTKMMERVEWMAEKATEVGLDEFSFFTTRFSERKALRTDRIDKIVVSAMKQSRKPWKPAVNDLIPFEQFLKKPLQGRGYIAHCYEEIPRTPLLDELARPFGEGEESVTLLIGPEGDFAVDEVKAAIDAGYVPVSLGQSRLRTETACLVAVMMAHFYSSINLR